MNCYKCGGEIIGREYYFDADGHYHIVCPEGASEAQPLQAVSPSAGGCPGARADGQPNADSWARCPEANGPANESFLKVLDTDSTVARIIRAGGTLEDCVCALHDQKQFFLKRVIELESIAPKKYRLSSGKIMIWRCPEDLVPITDLVPDAGPAAGQRVLPDNAEVSGQPPKT